MRSAKLPTHHIIILAKNDIGRYNLYQLISRVSSDLLCKKAENPEKSYSTSIREGLIIGSACEAGELYQAILEEQACGNHCETGGLL